MADCKSNFWFRGQCRSHVAALSATEQMDVTSPATAHPPPKSLFKYDTTHTTSEGAPVAVAGYSVSPMPYALCYCTPDSNILLRPAPAEHAESAKLFPQGDIRCYSEVGLLSQSTKQYNGGALLFSQAQGRRLNFVSVKYHITQSYFNCLDNGRLSTRSYSPVHHLPQPCHNAGNVYAASI